MSGALFSIPYVADSGFHLASKELRKQHLRRSFLRFRRRKQAARMSLLRVLILKSGLIIRDVRWGKFLLRCVGVTSK